MPNGLTESVVERRIRAYEAFGIHRTGWPGDDASAGWLIEELARSGIDAAAERFEFPKHSVEEARLTWGGGSTEGVPLHDGGFTGPAGIDAALAPVGGADPAGRIVVAGHNDARFSQAAVYQSVSVLERAGAAALILPRCDSLGAITLLNAARIGEPFGLPVLQVACPGVAGLEAAASAGEPASLVIDGGRSPATATNVTLTLHGGDPDASPLGIMTPRSGWFTCAAERGGGIAIWLGLAEALASMSDRRRTVQMVATSGHELNHYGLSAYLRARPGLAAGAAAWLHLGALIGSRACPVRVESNDPALRTLAESAFAASGAERWEMWDQKGGEAVNIDRAGGRYVSLRGGPAVEPGGDTFFHSPNDVVDRASDIGLVSAAGRASLAFVRSLLKA